MSARPTKWRVAEVVVGRRPAQRGVFDTLEEAQAFVDEMRIFWLGAPRWLYVINYLALGWVALFYTPQLSKEGGLWVLIPILIGGLLYSVGAIFYALKKPGTNAKYFGFHELFHIFVLAAWISQYLAISFAIYRD